jgi:hypothetical protein
MTTSIDAASCPQGDSMSQDVPKCPVLKNSLHEKQLAAVEMLVLGQALTSVAKALEIDRRTLYRWRKDDAFLAVLNARRREVWGDVVGRLRDLTHPSLEVMAQHLEDQYDRARFRAAALILRLAHLHKHAEGMD